MSRPITILFVGEDPAPTDAVRVQLAREPGVRVLLAPTISSGIEMARFTRPELILLGGPQVDAGVFEPCRLLRAEPSLSFSTVLLITPPDAEELRRAALREGFDGFLNDPVQATELQLLLHMQLRLRRAYDRLRTDGMELERLQKAAGKNLEQIVGLLACVVDMGRPGASGRGKRVGQLAHQLALRFGVPAMRLCDLQIAAQVHEIGWLVAGGAGADAAERALLPPWQRAVSTVALLNRVEGLAEAASLVRGLYENWDGTGFPDHLQQGQIPLRCRILRVVIDFMDEAERLGDGSEEEVLLQLAGHAGTLYDPMVIVHFRAMHADPTAPALRVDRVVLPISELRVGMILAEDLCTESGLKLLAQGTRLSPAALNTILRRHLAEPLLQGAAVLRGAA
jgi:response regulator RpfG family c-di-GMP phosphodiesterase